MFNTTRSLLLVLLVFAGGCADRAAKRDAWIGQHGGLTEDFRQTRANAVFSRLTAGHPELRASVFILSSRAVCAYAWPDRSIFVTAGMLAVASDDVLAAAMAHELGHLANDGHLGDVVNLNGADRNLNAERRADAFACRLLRDQQIPIEALARMLITVRDANLMTSTCQRAMTDRIAAVR